MESFQTYRHELENLCDGKTMSSYIKNMFDIIKNIKTLCNRDVTYLKVQSDSIPELKVSNVSAIGVMKLLIKIMNDNNEIIPLIKEKKDIYDNLLKYFTLIIKNLDNDIRKNSNIIYDEDDEKENYDPMIECDMLNESLKLMIDYLDDGTC